ncbi:MAG: DciA family protein [Acidipropionibacterium sp.]|jgi:predicted nucleic acid-binding Zn ribbon protein|nr:DciA family protein [Acidipropionibacterium sp.]
MPEPEETPDESDLQALAEHDEDGTDLARLIALSARGDPAGTPRRRTDSDVTLPPPKGVGRPRRRRRRHSAAWSGSGPDRRDPVPLGKVMDRFIADRDWGRQISLRVVLARWPELVGPANADHSWPVGYQDSVLTVQAESTVWATSLRSIAANLVAALNSRLGEGAVTRVVVQGPTAPSWKHGIRSVPGRGPRDTYG